jgi:hypothetical protein
MAISLLPNAFTTSLIKENGLPDFTEFFSKQSLLGFSSSQALALLQLPYLRLLGTWPIIGSTYGRDTPGGIDINSSSAHQEGDPESFQDLGLGLGAVLGCTWFFTELLSSRTPNGSTGTASFKLDTC